MVWNHRWLQIAGVSSLLPLGCAQDGGAAPTSSASIGASTGDEGDPTTSSTTTGSMGVTSAVPTTTSGNPSQGSDPSGDPSETEDNDCPGCINAAGICQAGNFDNACGAGGVECTQCEAPARCADGVCELPPECGPDNCAGCCNGDDCVQVPSDSACGAGGVECTECEAPSSCEGGICELPCDLDCLGCCTADGECVEDSNFNDDFCGFGGFECEACPGGQSCDFGICSSPGCLDTCDGCCIGETCYLGFDDDQCGFEETCEVCVSGESCDGFDCVLSQTAQWEVVLLSGEIAPTQPDGDEWDVFGGAPDPYLDIAELDFESSEVSNTYDPVWNETVTSAALTTALQAPLTFRMRDSDLLGSNLAGICEIELPDEAFGAPYEVVCNVDGDFAWSVVLSIQTVEK